MEHKNEKRKAGRTNGSSSVGELTKLYPTLAEMKQAERAYKERRGISNERNITEISPEYAAKLKKKSQNFDDLVKGIATDVSRRGRISRPANIDFDSGRLALWSAYKTVLREQGREFVSEKGKNQNVEVINKLLKYFLGYEGELDRKKGILLAGNPGSGKTLLLRLIKSLVDRIDYHHRKFDLVDVSSIELEIAMAGNLKPLEKYLKKQICFDDAGAEKIEDKIFSTHIELVPRVLHARYIEFQKTGLVTHLTTNLKLEDFRDRYGSRIESRIFEMFNYVEFVGSDKRKF